MNEGNSNSIIPVITEKKRTNTERIERINCQMKSNFQQHNFIIVLKSEKWSRFTSKKVSCIIQRFEMCRMDFCRNYSNFRHFCFRSFSTPFFSYPCETPSNVALPKAVWYKMHKTKNIGSIFYQRKVCLYLFFNISVYFFPKLQISFLFTPFIVSLFLKIFLFCRLICSQYIFFLAFFFFFVFLN